MVFMRKSDKIINHIIKFLRVLLEMQGPFVFAAEQLKEDIHDCLRGCSWNIIIYILYICDLLRENRPYGANYEK